MAWAGAVLNIVSAVAGVGGSVADGQASAAQRGYGALLARENSKMVGDQTAARELAVRRDAAQTLGEQRAAVAESGTGFGGSNGLIMAQDSALAELDALNTRYEGQLKMHEYDDQARMLGEEQPSGMQRVFGKRGLGALSHYNWAPTLHSATFGKPQRGW
jgi:hypothetical protein